MKPRHYIFLVLILVLACWNFYRFTHRHGPATPTAVSLADDSPWSAYDNAVRLRDAPEERFSPALQGLNAAIDHPSQPLSNDQLQDLHGCQMWLVYYRHATASINTPGSNKPADWNTMARAHTDSCTANHRDIAK